MGTRLFVGGLSHSTDDASLRAAFEPHGNVIEAKVILDRETGRSRGFGFVNFGDEAGAQAAIQAMNGTMLDGRSIRVNEAQERGGGGGGPRRGGPGRSGPRRSGGGGPPGRGGFRDRGPRQPEVVTRGRGPRDPSRGPTPAPTLPPPPDTPFENEFDDRPRRDPNRKKKKKSRDDRDDAKQPSRAPRKPNRRSSGRSWRDYTIEDEEDEY